MRAGLLSTALTVALKELRSGLRDRQTWVYTVILPLAMYPAMFWVILQGFTYLEGRDQRLQVHVALYGEAPNLDTRDLIDRLQVGERNEEGSASGGLTVARAFDELDPERAAQMLARASDEGWPDLILHLGDASGREAAIYYDSTRSRSLLALERLRARLDTVIEDLRRDAVRQRGADFETLPPYSIEAVNLASERDIGGFVLSLVLPLTFVIMAVMGAMIPAVDVTAGEKERGTAETTLLLPVSRSAIHLGKVAAVSVAALIATSLNLIGLALAAEHLLSGIPGADRLGIEIPWSAFLEIAPLCLIFLATISAFLVAAASFTQSFKQGQSLLGVVQLVFIFPAVIAISPGIELSMATAAVPVVQTVLAFKAVLQPSGPGDPSLWLEMLVVGLSQLVYAWLSVVICLRLGSREALLHSGGSVRRALSLLRSTQAPR